MIDRYGWTQQEINDTDEDLLQELMEYIAAKEKVREEAEKKQKEEMERRSKLFGRRK